MSYRIIIEEKVEKETRKIPYNYRVKLDKAILSLASNPRPRGCKKLTHKEGYRIRVGDYRVLYSIDDEAKVVIIYRIKIKGKKTYR